MTHCLRCGFDRVVIANSDGPTLPAAFLSRAFEALDSVGVVLGPCEDGGYYLVGLSSPQPRLFREVKMSTPTVLQDTQELARAEGLRVALLPAWYDVDTVQELKRLEMELEYAPQTVAPHTRHCLVQLRRR